MAKKRKFPNDIPDSRDHHKRARQHMNNDSAMALPPLPPITAELAKTVFTHASVVSHNEITSPSASYERLEFMGDAYIEFMATRLICEKFETFEVGRLSQLRELLVKNETLSEIAVKYGLDKKVRAAPDVKQNPRVWGKVKGDVVEAYVAAVALVDEKVGGSGFSVAENWLRRLWAPKLEGQLQEKGPNLKAKDNLSRHLVSKGVKLEYIQERPMIQLQGGIQTYFVGVFLTGWGYKKQQMGSGQGLSKTVAGNRAAEDALQHPLIETLTNRKKVHDETMRRQGDFRSPTGSPGQQHHRPEGLNKEPESSTGKLEGTTQERELNEKKRSMFMRTTTG